jgi:hypothetical protein
MAGIEAALGVRRRDQFVIDLVGLSGFDDAARPWSGLRPATELVSR